MYANMIAASLFVFILLSCPITSQITNQTDSHLNVNNTTVINQNNTNNTVGQPINQTVTIVSTKNINDVCLDGLRELALRQGYPRGSVFYCDCVGIVSPYSCSAIFIDSGISAT
jgi:hypothetical protein